MTQQPKILGSGEQVLGSWQPHLMHMLVVTRAFWIAALSPLCLIAALLYAPQLWLLPLLLCALAALALVPTLVSRRFQRIYLTNRRVLLESGAIGRDYQAFPFTQISEIRVDVDAWGKLLGSGTVIIKTASGQERAVHFVPKPYAFVARLHEAMHQS